MTVQVDEVHTDIAPANGPAAGPADRRAARPPWEAAEMWREARRRAAELDCRVAAEDFDD